MQVKNSATQLVSTEGNLVTSTDKQLVSTVFDNDALYGMLPDLVNDQFKSWYCKRFYEIGKDEVLKLASVARADAKTNPRGYFSVLLKRA